MNELLFKQIIYKIVNSILIFLHIKKRTVPNDIDLLKFFRVLRRYQKAGIPMDKALEEYLESNHEIMKPYLKNVIAELNSGRSFSEAMIKQKIIPNFIVQMLKIGETTNMNIILDEIVYYLKQKTDIARKIKSNMFTVKVMFAGLAILIITAVYMLGRMKKIFDSLNADLPTITKLLLTLGNFAVYYIWLLPFVIIALLIIYKYITKTYKEKIDNILLHTPVYKGILKLTTHYYICKILAILLRNGIPTYDALRYTAMAIDNSRYRDELLDIAEKVNNAYTLSAAVEEVNEHYKLLDNDFIFVIRSIEQTGIVADSFDELSEDYKEQLLSTLVTLPDKISTPIMGFAGVIVITIYISVYIPLTTLTQSVQGIGMR
ncbi:type II secretion system F family protein [Megamonas funiformis]|jgi:type II secretory pathway component PulF|uniref:type II secretion system F family protein n=1 Tax=Megamonas funiformis TaxID=437897 RepID=UPI0022DFCA61|nr:type II secretion system F family protein [Megamonas funiformis]